ncbi:MAG: TetR/AcrR family transcriptional regulator [Alphaproteobacteria bacterium]|nr:MAG: TetR/AcrR family transcriptional regulator [Alphaproteobacteria bacterium]
MPWQKQFDVDETLDRAMNAFWARGYEATSVQDLVTCTGVNRGSLYATYGDKRALFLAALRRYGEIGRRALLTDLEARYRPLEAIHRLFMFFAAQGEDGRPGRGCFMTNTALELAAHDPETREIVNEGMIELEAFFTRMIRKGQKQGEIAPTVPPHDTARGLLASLLGLIVLVRSRPERAVLQAVVREAMRRLS